MYPSSQEGGREAKTELLKGEVVLWLLELGSGGKILVVGGGGSYRDGCCEQSPEIALWQIRASSRWLQRDLLLTRAEPGSDAGWALGEHI